MGEDLAPNLGGTKKVFSRPNFRKNVHFAGYKFLMTLFLVIDLVLRIFPFFSHIFRIFTMLNVVYDHFLTRKPSFFTLFILSRTSDKTTSQNIGGTNAWAVPPTSNFGGTVPPSPPRSPPLRPFLWRPFKSTNTQRRSRHSTDTVSEFHAEAPQANESEGVAKIPTWRLERDSNPRSFGRKATNLPMRHHVSRRHHHHKHRHHHSHHNRCYQCHHRHQR